MIRIIKWIKCTCQLKAHRICIPRIRLAILLGCLVCSVSSAEYEELEAVKQSSREVLGVYARRLAREDGKFEGIVKFGQALQAIESAEKIDLGIIGIIGTDPIIYRRGGLKVEKERRVNRVRPY